MVAIATTATFDRLFSELPRKIQKKAARRAELFKENPFSPTLRTEKLHRKQYDVWSFRIDRDYRIVFEFVAKGYAEFRFIGHHNKIYDYDLFKA